MARYKIVIALGETPLEGAVLGVDSCESALPCVSRLGAGSRCRLDGPSFSLAMFQPRMPVQGWSGVEARP